MDVITAVFLCSKTLICNAETYILIDAMGCVEPIIMQITFDLIVLCVIGPQALIYLIVGTFLAMGWHPVAGHFISEHYVKREGQETYSYYGWLNKITFNVGFHNEHHDFPNIAGSRLPELYQIAPEYYDELYSHQSWTVVIYDLIFNRKINLFCRIKRSM